MIATQTIPGLTLDIPADGTEAYLCVAEHIAPGTITVEDLEALLRDSGVVHGVLADVIAGLPNTLTAGTRVLVARGTPPCRGKDGWLEFPRPATESAGPDVRVNPKGQHRVHNVREGEIVAIVHAPEPGQPGISVTGEPLVAIPGAEVKVTAGENTVISPQNPADVRATADGNLVAGADGTISVQTVLTISGNVDLSVGNIDFVGSMVVEGDVLNDFVIRVKKTLLVKGNVEDSTIEAGGDVTIAKGFFGHGKGKVVTEGSVKVHHILNQNITAGRDVYIETEAVNATVRSGGKICAPRAIVAGGTMDALHEVEVGVLGSADGGQVRVRVGKRGRILERIGQLDKDIKHCEKQQTDVKTAVYKFVKMKVDGMILTAEQEVALGKLQEAQKLIPRRIGQMQEERTALTAELQKNSEAKIEVHDTVHENVLIELNNIRKVIDSAIQAVVFTERSGVIDARSR